MGGTKLGFGGASLLVAVVPLRLHLERLAMSDSGIRD